MEISSNQKIISPKLSIIIVNYNGGEMIIECIKSIIKETSVFKYEIIVVDNDSSDNSVKTIKEKFTFIKVILNNANIGFAAANNIGFSVAIGDYVLLLNPDTQIIDGAIDKSLTYLQENSEVGVLGCKVMWETGERQSTLIKFPTLRDMVINLFVPNQLMRKSRWLGKSRYVGINYDRDHDVEVVAGCFMMLPLSVVDNIGRLDEDFFMFGEEIEWCWRIHQSEKKIRYFSEAVIMHHGGGCSSSLSYRKALLIAKGQLMVFKKTRGVFVATIANVLMLLRDFPRSLVWVVIKLFDQERADRIVPLKVSHRRLSYLFYYLIGFEKEI